MLRIEAAEYGICVLVDTFYSGTQCLGHCEGGVRVVAHLDIADYGFAVAEKSGGYAALGIAFRTWRCYAAETEPFDMCFSMCLS